MAIQYQHPKLFDFFISWLYTKRFMDRFAEEIGKSNSIFEVAAGYGRMSRYMDSSNEYYGIDLNKRFVEFGRKQGLGIEIKDALDKKSYKKRDVFLVVDFVHHISADKLKVMFDLVFTHAEKKVIVVEPSFQHFIDRFGIFGKCAGWIMARIDSDGFNKIDRFFTEKEYDILFKNRFGSSAGSDFKMKCTQLDGHYLVVFTKID